MYISIILAPLHETGTGILVVKVVIQKKRNESAMKRVMRDASRSSVR